MILIVGGGGFVGSAVAHAFTTRGDTVHVLTRSTPQPESAVTHFGDARLADCGLDAVVAQQLADAAEVIVFAAGPVDFEIGPADVQRLHLAPLRSVCAFADRCPRLRSFVLVSSFLAPGRVDRSIRSDYLPPRPDHHNFYEWAKFEQERLVLNSDLPVRIVRAGHVWNSTDGSQRTRRPSGLFEGLPVLASTWPIPIRSDARYWCAPADFVAQLVVYAATRADRMSIWAVDPAAPTYGQLLDLLALRHGLRTRRIRASALSELMTSIVPMSWFGLTAPRSLLAYANASYDLDLRCIDEAISQGDVEAPENLDYVVDTIDHEMARAQALR